MVGVWFKGIRGNNRIVYPSAPGPGNSGVLLGDRSQVYGLFALPSHLGNLLEKAKAQERQLTAAEQSKIMKHCEKVAKKMLSPAEAARVKADYMLSFPVALNRAQTAVNGRVVIAGDAVQTVNPYTGMGANVSMQIARLAAKSVVAANGASSTSVARRLLGKYSRRAVGAAKAMHNLCMPLKTTFNSPKPRYKQQLRAKTRALAKKGRTKARRGSTRSRQRRARGKSKSAPRTRTAKAR
jgi:2-polyprenyl-6-methoxyphenol hydroxylase-like FAD-dependent oxidoreductase